MILHRGVLFAFLITNFIGCVSQDSKEPSASKIFFGGDIVTVNDAMPTVEALAVSDGKIIAVGAKKDILDLADPKTVLVDLKGKTLIPGFIDAHSHYFSALTVANQVNLYPPPSGPGKDVPSILKTLKEFSEKKGIKKGELIQAYGYDDSVMPNSRLLNRDDLDKTFPDNPVVIGHVSMHGGVLNSLAQKKWNITEKTKTPPGGIIVRKKGTNEPYGLIMETAWIPIFENLPKPKTTKQIVEWSLAAQNLYASYGVTTAHEGATHSSEFEIMKKASENGVNLIDVVSFPFITEVDKVLENYPKEKWGQYNNGLKVGGVKITIDGSPQGRTALFSTPYLRGGPSGEKNWKGGDLTFPEDTIEQYIKKVYDMNVPLNLHANGDGAIDTFLRLHKKIASGSLAKSRNITIIHSQFVRKDQLKKYAEYKIRPSFYTLHTYYFADTHIKNRGLEQTEYISPMKDALELGIHPTNHTDFVVAPLDQLFVLWSAVNRKSRGGLTIGASQKISALDALKAQTIFAAEQYEEESLKGTLEEGKIADMVVLDRNPLTVDPDEIKNIKILETIKNGETIYSL